MTEVAFATLSLFFVFLQSHLPLPLQIGAKIAPLVVLAAVPWQAGQALAVAALVCSGLGDIALLFRGSVAFSVGLGFFLLAHITYMAAFLSHIEAPTVAAVPYLSAMVILLVLMLRQLLPAPLGVLRSPVLAYIAVIGLMGVSSTMRAPFSNRLALGSFVFMVSDSLIALNKFVRKVPLRNELVMATYYIAQYLIVDGLVHKN